MLAVLSHKDSSGELSNLLLSQSMDLHPLMWLHIPRKGRMVSFSLFSSSFSSSLQSLKHMEKIDPAWGMHAFRCPCYHSLS